MRVLLVVSLLLAFVSFSSGNGEAQEGGIPGVSCRQIILRSTPEVAGIQNILERLPGGVSVTILELRVRGISGWWDHVRINDTGQEGWVWAPYVTELPYRGMVSVNELNLRTEPTRHADIITVLARDTEFEPLGWDSVQGNGGSWVKVRVLETGQEGWIKSEYARNSGTGYWCRLPSLYEHPTPGTAVVWTRRNIDLLDNEGGLVERLYPGMQLIVLDRDGKTIGHRTYLSLVQIEGTDTVGWVYSSAVIFLPFSVMVSVGELNMRTTPNLDAEVINVLPAQTCLEILASDNQLENGGPWFRVREPVSGGEGWVSANYVDTLPDQSGSRFRWFGTPPSEGICES